MLRLLFLAGAICFLPATAFGQAPSTPQTKYPVLGNFIPNELGTAATDWTPPPTIELDGKAYFLLDKEKYEKMMAGTPGKYEGSGGPAAGGPEGESAGAGAGAGAAVDPSVPLAQIQFQNLFIPHTRGASGYANTFILQPVIPVHLSSEILPYHIIRPTLPLISPADPDGPRGRKGGVGDLTIADVFVHPFKEIKTNAGGGYVLVAPTSTDRSLGLGEWQLGPAVFAITRAVPKWVIGTLVQVPMSLESDAYVVQVQLIATRLLEREWYVGWGDTLLTLDDQNGRYSIPLQLRVGKVITVGKQPVNVFLQGEYIPRGFQSGGVGEEWAIKLSITPLLPGMKIGPFFGHDHHMTSAH